MRRILSGLGILFLVLFCSNAPLQAATQTVTWDGSGGSGSNSLKLDDNGGADSDNEFTFNNVGHTSTTDFIVSDGSGVALGDSELSPLDFVGNGLNVFTGPFPNLPNVDQIVLQTDTPFAPITMSVNHTNLQLQEIVYVNNAKDYAIIELHAVNQGAAATPIFLAVANDWDVNNGQVDAANGFDTTRGLVFQYDDGQPENYTIGMASLNNPVDQFLLGTCCGLTDAIVDPAFADPYVLQRHFLNNTKPTEECDDGGNAPADGAGDTCSPKCHNAVAGQVCGNGTIEGDEECDDGNLTPGDGCDDRCLNENSLCGNGTLDTGEECDDGNRASGDGCDLDCKAEFFFHAIDFCGDGIVNNGATGSQADIANDDDLESSLSVKFAGIQPSQGATAAFCLIGATGADQTDSENHLKAKTDDCLAFYQQNIAVCGNGIQNAGEQCDDGNTTNGDGCENNCTLSPCGNGIVDAGETCDDGNTVDGDGCDSNCTLSVCGNGITDADEACDDGNTVDGDGCDSNCTLPACGNGITDAGEACDDGNTANGDGCSSICQDETAPLTGAVINGGGCSLNAGARPIDAGSLMFLTSVLVMGTLYLRKRA